MVASAAAALAAGLVVASAALELGEAHWAATLVALPLLVAVLVAALVAYRRLVAPAAAALGLMLLAIATGGLVAWTDDARWAVAFALGLLHGFGFAGVLADTGLASLLCFNLGVELGQAAIVAVFLPLAFLARRTAAYRYALLAGSTAVGLLALHWSFDRFTS